VWSRWLDGATDLDELLALLVPAGDDVLAMHPVAPDVGNVRNNGPHLVDEVDEAQQAAAEAAQGEIPGQGSLL
jgi:putative SOS response-associated peptidase YedK